MLFHISCSEKNFTEEEKFSNTTFDVNGKSDFTFVNYTSDSISFNLDNWFLLPSDHIEYQKKIPPNDSFQIKLKTQGFNYFDFDFADSAYKFFTASNSSVSFHKYTDTSYFTGDFNSINNYWKRLGGNYYRNHETNMNLVNLTQREHYSYQDLMNKNDTVIQTAIKQLEDNHSDLPEWYLNLESAHLRIQGAHAKFSSLVYRKKMLNYKDEIPQDYVTQIMKDVPIENEKLMGFNLFPHLLRWYSQNTIWPINDTSIQSNPFPFDSLIHFMSTQFSPSISDYAISTYLCTNLKINPEQEMNKWIQKINNPVYQSIVKSIASQKEVLPKGSSSPSFTGLQMDSSTFNSQDLKDSLILINFWASYCKPCFNKFEYENTLVDYFKTKPVKIVNVCIESDWKHFVYLTDIHKLKTTNVFIPEEQLKDIKEAFDIQKLPHSTLVDRNSLIIKNRYRIHQDSTKFFMESLLQ